MRTVYADVVFVINFVCDFALLYLSAYSLSIKVKIVRLIISAFIGAVYALIVAIINLSGMLCLILSFAALLIMSFVSFYGVTKKAFVRLVINVYVYSFILCGLVYTEPFRRFTYGITVVLMSLFLVVAIRRLGIKNPVFTKRKSMDLIFKVRGMQKTLCLIIDTGNILTDPVTMLPVIIISRDAANLLDLEKVRSIPFQTVVGEGELYILKTEEIYVPIGKTKIRLNAVAGCCFDNSAALPCDGILPASIIENLTEG